MENLRSKMTDKFMKISKLNKMCLEKITLELHRKTIKGSFIMHRTQDFKNMNKRRLTHMKTCLTFLIEKLNNKYRKLATDLPTIHLQIYSTLT